MKNLWILQFLGTFLGPSKKPFYKVNRANGQILYRVSVFHEDFANIKSSKLIILDDLVIFIKRIIDYLGLFTKYECLKTQIPRPQK